MIIGIGSDHGGFNLKEILKKELLAKGFNIVDEGCFDGSSCNYPDVAKQVCDKVIAGTYSKAILVCGTGIGISIAANKVKGIRAAACQDYFAAKYSRLHNDAQVLCLGERVTGFASAVDMAEVFLTTEHEGDRHQMRVDLISSLEK